MIFDKAADEEITARLLNWGIWNNRRGLPKFNYPSYVEIMRKYFPADGRFEPDDIDAQHLEDIISTLNVAGRGGFGWGDIYAFTLKLEFIEFGRPRESKAEHVRRKFDCPCSERTFRHHLYRAKRAVWAFAEKT